ncbi:hypothetical protein C8034_v004457 [Colletotrichum sidae]|uniref:Uncharacterized protein n=1 Tax=Colletotrichum sidae TaxID=1347389 RepID=A0A4R8T888_9PEZI|nr:hypothetical protein C8034_v004457 [Colletotrichum sidae]
MKFLMVSFLSLAAFALAAPAPEPVPQRAPTCGKNSDCATFCNGCSNPQCGLSVFGDFRCECGGCGPF